MLWKKEHNIFGRVCYRNTETGVVQYTMPLCLQGTDEDEDEATDNVVVISSTHGKLRRSQRRIDKLDLQAAVKYGTKIAGGKDPRTGRPRWRYEHGDIVYITDEFSTKEVTSWQLPEMIEAMRVDERTKLLRTSRRNEIKLQPSTVTSHTVCVVDQSGSMRKHDVGKYGSRSQTVYTSLALWLVKKQMDEAKERLTPQEIASQVNVVSLIEMREVPEVVFEAEPLDADLFNRFVLCRDESRPRSDGNYMPSLDAAEKLLKKFAHGGCALLLLFLSDGKPSDLWTPGATDTPEGRKSLSDRHETMMRNRISELSRQFGKRLTVGTIGFADEAKNFSVLKGMAEEANTFSKGMYLHARADLGLAITSLVTSLTSTMTELTSAGGKQRTVREVTREKPEESDDSSWKIHDFWWYDEVNRVRYENHANGTKNGDWKWIQTEFEDPQTNGLVVRKSILGEGAERVVYGMHEVSLTLSSDGRKPVKILMRGPKLVAKENRFVEEEEREMRSLEFHKIFAKTQATAQSLAEAFNAKVEVVRLAYRSTRLIPRIQFLPCTIYRVFDNDGSIREVLAEKRLDVRRYEKFNNNAGFVKGQKAENAVGITLGKLSAGMELIEEEDGEDYSDGDDDLQHDHGAEKCLRDVVQKAQISIREKVLEFQNQMQNQMALWTVKPEDVPQAFSHFSYQRSKKKMLVCDLQGVFNDSANDPVFELTDPVIHYTSNTGREKVFGRTDKGRTGVRNFFRTHKCNALCELLKLRKWRWS